MLYPASIRADATMRRRPTAIAAGAAMLAALVLAGCQHLPAGLPGSQAGQSPSAPARGDGAIASVVSTMKERAQPAPPWMVGKFVGRSLRSGLQNIEVDVFADGSMRGRIGDLSAQGQYIGNSRILWAHGNESMVERRDSGFRVTQLKDPANVIEYQRR